MNVSDNDLGSVVEMLKFLYREFVREQAVQEEVKISFFYAYAPLYDATAVVAVT